MSISPLIFSVWLHLLGSSLFGALPMLFPHNAGALIGIQTFLHQVPEPIDKARSKDSKRSDEDSKVSAIIKAPNLSNLEKAQLLFPDFAPDKKLRFSRMFGNSVTGRDLDKTWKYGKKKKKYKHPVIENGLWTKVSSIS